MSQTNRLILFTNIKILDNEIRYVTGCHNLRMFINIICLRTLRILLVKLWITVRVLTL